MAGIAAGPRKMQFPVVNSCPTRLGIPADSCNAQFPLTNSCRTTRNDTSTPSLQPRILATSQGVQFLLEQQHYSGTPSRSRIPAAPAVDWCGTAFEMQIDAFLCDFHSLLGNCLIVSASETEFSHREQEQNRCARGKSW
jgi:hypothetical protein